MSTKAGFVAHVRWARLLAKHARVQYRRTAEHHHRHWRHHDWRDHNLRLGHHCSRHGHHRRRLGHRHHRLSLGHRHRLSYRCHSVSIVTAFWSALAATAPKLAAVSFAVPPNLLAAIAHNCASLTTRQRLAMTSTVPEDRYPVAAASAQFYMSEDGYMTHDAIRKRGPTRNPNRTPSKQPCAASSRLGSS